MRLFILTLFKHIIFLNLKHMIWWMSGVFSFRPSSYLQWGCNMHIHDERNTETCHNGRSFISTTTSEASREKTETHRVRQHTKTGFVSPYISVLSFTHTTTHYTTDLQYRQEKTLWLQHCKNIYFLLSILAFQYK